MSTCPALVVNCVDPRLQGSNAEAIAWAAGFQPGSWEQLSYPGPSLWLVNPHEAVHAEIFQWLLEEVSERVHHVNTVVLAGHNDCAGIERKYGLADPAQEKGRIVTSMRVAAERLKSLHPELNVILVFVTIHQYQPAGMLPSITCEVVPLSD